MRRSPTETIRLFRAIGTHRRDRALFLVAYRHGLRASEVGLLRVEDLDFKALRIMVHRLKGSLRRFTRANVQYPTYTALAELGRAVKTVFLCHYLHSLALRHEIHEGLNVIEQWNSANDFVFFARKGELASNRREDHEVSMLALHLLQNAMVYINTLMIQQTLA